MAPQLSGTGGTMRPRGFSSTREALNDSGGSSESSQSESSSTESIDAESSDTESTGSESTIIRGGPRWRDDGSCRTSSWECTHGKEGSGSVHRTAADGPGSNAWRRTPRSQQNMEFMTTLGTVAVVRNILEEYRENLEAKLAALKKQFLHSPPLPDSVRLELLRSVNGVVDAINGRHRRRGARHSTSASAPATTDWPTGTLQRNKGKEERHSAAAKEPPADEQQTAQRRNSRELLLPTNVQQGRSTAASPVIHHQEGPSTPSATAVTGQESTGNGWRKRPLTVDGREGKGRSANSARELRHARQHSNAQAPLALGGPPTPRKLPLGATDDRDSVSYGEGDEEAEDEDVDSEVYTSDRQDLRAVSRDEDLRAPDFIGGFRLMLQPALDDPLERYVRIRRPDSAVLRLLDYYQQQADLYEVWDWERDPLLGGSSGVSYPPTSALDVEEMLRDAVALHEELLTLNVNNTRALRNIQEQLADAWMEADPAIKEANRLFVKSVVAVAEAKYVQKQIDEWNLTVLAERALGKREKYLVYDPATGRLKLLRDAYMADIIPKEIDSEKLTRRLNRKIAALFRSADKRRTSRPHTRRESFQTKRDLEDGRKAPQPSAAAQGISAALPGSPGGTSHAAKLFPPGADVAGPVAESVSKAAPLPIKMPLPCTADLSAKQKMIPGLQLHAVAKHVEKSGKQPPQLAKIPQPDTSRPLSPKGFLPKAPVGGGALMPKYVSPVSPRTAATTTGPRDSAASFTTAALPAGAVATASKAAAAPFLPASKSSLPAAAAAAPKQEGEAFVDSFAKQTLLRSPGLRKGSDSTAVKPGAPPFQSTSQDLPGKRPPGLQEGSHILRASEAKGKTLVAPALNKGAGGGKFSAAALPLKTVAATPTPSTLKKTTPPSLLSPSKALPAASPSLKIAMAGKPKTSAKPIQLQKRLPLPPSKVQA